MNIGAIVRRSHHAASPCATAVTGRGQRLGEQPGLVAGSVVGEDPLNRDAVGSEEGVRPLPEAGRGFLALVGEDLAVGQAGVVVDGGVDLLTLLL